MPSPEVNIGDIDVDANLSGTVGTAVSGSITTELIGDQNNPIETKIAGGMTVTAVGILDQPIAAHVTGQKDKPIATHITGDENNPVATSIDIKNIPHLTINDIKDILTPRIRMHIPNYEQLCFKLFGVEIFSMCLSGETQVITDEYIPNRYEKCQIKCPDEDFRPFPKQTPVHSLDNKMDNANITRRSK